MTSASLGRAAVRNSVRRIVVPTTSALPFVEKLSIMFAVFLPVFCQGPAWNLAFSKCQC